MLEDHVRKNCVKERVRKRNSAARIRFMHGGSEKTGRGQLLFQKGTAFVEAVHTMNAYSSRQAGGDCLSGSAAIVKENSTCESAGDEVKRVGVIDVHRSRQERA